MILINRNKFYVILLENVIKDLAMTDNWIAIDDVILWDKNPNMGDIGMISESIRYYGFRDPIGLFQGNVTKDGNHRIQALLHLRDQTIPKDEKWIPSGPCIRTNKQGQWEVQYVDNTDLSPKRGNALGLALNRAVRLGHDDMNLLAEHLEAMQSDDDTSSIASIGYSQEELQEIQKVLNPPTIDDLKKTYGEINEEDFWPTIKATISPQLYEKFQNSTYGEDDTERMIYLLENL